MKLKFPDEAAPPSDPLPEYKAPPVTETSVGIQFDGLSGFQSLYADKFWQRIENEYPKLEEVPPLDPAFETFGSRESGMASPQLRLFQGPPQTRFFFISEDDSELVQLQHDRLIFNWRKRAGAGDYPRYGHVRAKLEGLFKHLVDWAADMNFGSPRPTQCEALYVNEIPLRNYEQEDCGLSYFFHWFDGLGGVTEDGAMQFRRRLVDENNDPKARLYFNLRYGTELENRRSAQLNLQVRGLPLTPSFDDCLKMIDAEREIIVRTFTKLTTANAHKIWGRER